MADKDKDVHLFQFNILKIDIERLLIFMEKKGLNKKRYVNQNKKRKTHKSNKIHSERHNILQKIIGVKKKKRNDVFLN